MRAKGSYFRGSSWVSPAPSADLDSLNSEIHWRTDQVFVLVFETPTEPNRGLGLSGFKKTADLH